MSTEHDPCFDVRYARGDKVWVYDRFETPPYYHTTVRDDTHMGVVVKYNDTYAHTKSKYYVDVDKDALTKRVEEEVPFVYRPSAAVARAHYNTNTPRL